MKRIAFWDCFSGISGDMALGALVDAGLDVDQLRAALRRLNVGGWEIAAERVVGYGVAGTRLRVSTAEQRTHRHLSDIAAILDASALDADVRERALRIFERLADAEAAVHGTTRDAVHFHEVGALDAIVDIVGIAIGLKLLGIERVFASALPLGSGWMNIAHGTIPIPGPAVLRLLGDVGAPIQPDDTPFELTTPTGAAILAEIATFRRPAMTIQATGYGFGTRDIGRLNAVRVWIGDAEDVEGAQSMKRDPNASLQSVLLLTANIDDQPPEQLAYAAEQLLAGGALDVWWTPIGMKKGRGALMLSVLVDPADEQAAVNTVFRETTSLGVRREPIERWVCERTTIEVPTLWGNVRTKQARWQGQLLGAAPEYEDCARIAREYGVPLRHVYKAVQIAILEQIDNEPEE
jgi:pyridinium-3,5-bisthiocarboxylic acid mononucleotide nickel chelatase